MFEQKTPKQVYDALQKDGRAVLIDCRTMAEWLYVGLPDLSPLGKQPLCIEWVDGKGVPNPNFIDDVRKWAEPDTPIYILCRSGVRSAHACKALGESGFNNLCNVIGGFEGDLNFQNRRACLNGWKYDQLPWHQK